MIWGKYLDPKFFDFSLSSAPFCEGYVDLTIRARSWFIAKIPREKRDLNDCTCIIISMISYGSTKLFLWLSLSNLTTFFTPWLLMRQIRTHIPPVANKKIKNWPSSVDFSSGKWFWDDWLCILPTYNVFLAYPPLSNDTDRRPSAFRHYNRPSFTLDLLKSVFYSLQTIHFENKEFWILIRRKRSQLIYLFTCQLVIPHYQHFVESFRSVIRVLFCSWNC